MRLWGRSERNELHYTTPRERLAARARTLWFWEEPRERWSWLLDAPGWAPQWVRHLLIRLWVRVVVHWPQARDRLSRRWGYRLHRVGLLLRPWPVHVLFSGYCCDTGPYSWRARYGWHGWRWPGLVAWLDLHPDKLCDMSDGPTDYHLCSRREYAAFSAPHCEGCGAGNGPYSSTGFNLCIACHQAEAAAQADYDYWAPYQYDLPEPY